MLNKFRQVIAAVVLCIVSATAMPALAAPQSPAAPTYNLNIQVNDEDKVDLNGDGQVSLEEARLMASYRLALKGRQEFLDKMVAEGQTVSQETLDLLAPKDPRIITPDAYDSETIRNVLMNLWASWESTMFQVRFMTKFVALGGTLAAANALRARWPQAGNLIANLITWSYLTPDIIKQQFTNLIRNAGYSETIANNVGVVMKQFIMWLCNHPEWFD